MLRTTTDGLALIEAFEGLKTKAYLCPAGKPTIGIGHTSAAGGTFTLKDGRTVAKVALGQEITAAEADRLFAADIDRFCYSEGAAHHHRKTPPLLASR